MTSSATINARGWFAEESRKCDSLTNEKLQEFQRTVDDHKEWLQSYLDQIIHGKSSQDISSLLKTPAANKNKRKETDDQDAQQNPTKARPIENSDISSFMQKIRERITSNIPMSANNPFTAPVEPKPVQQEPVVEKEPAVTRPKRTETSVKTQTAPSKTNAKPVAPADARRVLNPPKIVAKDQTKSRKSSKTGDELRQSFEICLPHRSSLHTDIESNVPAAFLVRPSAINTDPEPVKETLTESSEATSENPVVANLRKMNEDNMAKSKQPENGAAAAALSSKLPVPNKLKLAAPSSLNNQTNKPGGYQFKKPTQSSSIKPAATNQPAKNTLQITIPGKTTGFKPEDEARRLKLANMQKSIEQSSHNPPGKAAGQEPPTPQNQSIAKILANEDVLIPEILTDEDSSSDEECDNKANTKFNLPEWAKSPNLKRSLQNQMNLNPDMVFGPFNILKLEDIFQGSSLKRFRVRSSSANWSKDKLTDAEAKRYDNYMGYQNRNL